MQGRLLAWLTVAVHALLLAACGGAQTVQDSSPPEVQGEPPPAVGVFADETIRDLLALAPDGIEAVKILRMPPDFMTFLETVDPEPGFGGTTVLEWILPLLSGIAGPGPTLDAVLWVRQPHVGLVVTPLEQGASLDDMLSRLIMTTPDVDREAVQRFGQTWTRLTEAGRSPDTRSPMEILVRWHDDRFLLLVAPAPDAPGPEARRQALAERLDPSAFSERWAESILESLSALDAAIHEAIRPREDAESAVRRWAAGTPGGHLDPALASELQTLLAHEPAGMDLMSSAGAVLPDAARFGALLRAHQGADDVFRDAIDLASATRHLAESAHRTTRCLAREEEGRTWLAYRYNHHNLRAHARIAHDRNPDRSAPSLIRSSRNDPFAAPVTLLGSTSTMLREASAAHEPIDLSCLSWLGDPAGLVHTHHAFGGALRTFPSADAPEREMTHPSASRQPDGLALLDRILQNGLLEVDPDSGALVVHLLAPPPLRRHLDALAAGIPGIRIEPDSAEEAGALRYHSMRLTWRPFDESPTGPDREGPLHLWTLQFDAPGQSAPEPTPDTGPVWHAGALHSALQSGSMLHPAELVDALSLPWIAAGLTNQLGRTVAPVLDTFLHHRPGTIALLHTGSEDHASVAVEISGFRQLDGPGAPASEWGDILAHDDPYLLLNPDILGHAMLQYLPASLLHPEGAPEGLRFLRTNHQGPGGHHGWHAIMIHSLDHGAFELALDDHDAEHRDAADTRPPPRWTLDVGRPVVIETFGQPLLMALHTADDTPIGSPFALASTSRIPRVQGSVLDLVFTGLGGGVYGAHLRADEPMELQLVCVEGCDQPLTIELVFE
ncbi:MAG: hypothetical protein EA398_01155 [Deltaproteobacteria bacterium]|nr:MAG: hypothetical protein EA398_01155 [Deltaproteobacteria bacterium]